MPVRRNIYGAVKAVAGHILDDTTVLGVTGTLAPASVTLDHLGGIADDLTVLSGCNIGTVTLVDCFGVAVASSLYMNDNRLIAGTTGAGPGIQWLIEQIYAAIVTGASGAMMLLNISGNAVPNAATMALVKALCVTSSVTVDVPTLVHGTAAGVEIAEQDYLYYAEAGSWSGNSAADTAVLYHDGSTWVIYDDVNTWVGPALTMAGNYVLAGHDTITITVTP